MWCIALVEKWLKEAMLKLSFSTTRGNTRSMRMEGDIIWTVDTGFACCVRAKSLNPKDLLACYTVIQIRVFPKGVHVQRVG